MGNRLVKNTMIYALGDITPKLLGLLVLPLMTAYLAPAQYGVINYVTSIVTFLTIVSVLSLNTYYLVYYHRQKDDTARKELLGALVVFVFLFNVVLTVFLLLFGGALFAQMGQEIDFYPFVALGVGTTFMQMFAIFPSALYRMEERPGFLTMLVVARSVLQVGLGVWAVIGLGAGAKGILWANFLVATVFAVVFGWITMRKAILRINWHIVGQALRFSLPLVPGALAFYVVNLSDRVLIEKYFNFTQLGLYTTAANVALMLNIVSYGAYKAFEPQFFKAYTEPNFAQFFNRVRNGFLFVMLVGVMGLGLFAREFFELFTANAYHGAYYYVPMILVGILFNAIAMLYSTVVSARGKTKAASGIMIVCAGVSISLNIVLLPRLGVAAAALTSALSYGLLLAGAIWFSGLRGVGHWRQVCAVAVSGIVLFFGVYVVPAEGFWLGALVKGTMFLLALGTIVLLLGIRYHKLLATFRGR